MKRSIITTCFTLSIVAAVIFFFSGYGYRMGVWELGTAMTILRYAAYAAIGLLAIQLILLFNLKETLFRVKTMAVFGFLVTLVVTCTAGYFFYKAQTVPPIHDITTDMEEPPEFVSLVRLRENAPNPPEYEGEESARLQREAYPDIEPLYFSVDRQEVMDEIVALVASRRWEIVSINRQEGRIEATETLAWFGFRDDVVFRIRDTNGGTRVDMRSKSRIGTSDLGVNADRIDRFMRDLENRIDT